MFIPAPVLWCIVLGLAFGCFIASCGPAKRDPKLNPFPTRTPHVNLYKARVVPYETLRCLGTNCFYFPRQRDYQ